MSIKEQVFNQLDKGRICVFPTEASRRFYLEAYAADSGRGMIFQSQTMAWDSFHQLFLDWDRSLAPSSPWIRRLFAALFVYSEEAGALRRFALEGSPVRGGAPSSGGFAAGVGGGSAGGGSPVRRGAAAGVGGGAAAGVDSVLAAGGGGLTREGLASYLASILPRIPLALERAEGALRADLAMIKAAYERFLAERGLCETLWIEPRPPEGFRAEDYAICFPEAVEGFPLFCCFVDRNLFSYVGGGEVEGRLEVYPNTVAELKAQFRRIRALLDEGTPESDIAISCADLESIRPYLEREARLKGVRLDIKEGRKLTSYGAGRFFLDLRRIAAEDRSLGSVESLLLNPSYPWKEPEALRGLVEAGIFGQVSGGRDEWLALLPSRGDEGRRRRSLFLRLDSLAGAFGRCRTVEEIRRAFNGFQDEFLAPQAFEGAGEEERDVYAYCVRQLDELEKAMAACSLASLPDLFGFYVRALSSTAYVPRGRREGIPVYRYSQGAGLCPPHHFFLNIGARSVRAKRVYLGFLPAIDSSDPLISGFDGTEPLLALASRSGDDVRLSGPETGVEGAVLCPVAFLEGGRRKKIGRPEGPDEYKRELAYWAEGRTEGFVPNQLQKDSLLAFCEVGAEEGGRSGRSGSMPAPRTGGLSAKRIDDYLRCPFYWFCVHVLGVEDGNPFVPPSEDPRVSGNLVHAVLERFFAEAEVVDPSKASSYRSRLLELLEEELPRFKAMAPMGEAVWLYVRRKLRTRIEAGLDFSPLEGFKTAAVERSLVSEGPGGALEGRIDLVFSMPGGEGLGVLDLKSGSLAERKGRIGIGDWDRNGMDSVQLPVYAHLLAAAGEGFPVWSAYYSLKDNKFYIGWSPSDLDRGKVEEALAGRARQVEEGIAGGAYAPAPSDEACKFCKFHTACRARYVAR